MNKEIVSKNFRIRNNNIWDSDSTAWPVVWVKRYKLFFNPSKKKTCVWF